jgi:Na+-translocating ferredoxin:NAD+ oxidoreductase RnfD subunit
MPMPPVVFSSEPLRVATGWLLAIARAAGACEVLRTEPASLLSSPNGAVLAMLVSVSVPAQQPTCVSKLVRVET